ncbi:citrate synthase-lysine N-methyltransferase CSKMT, mitochondrial isoform X1 [Mustela nigripes]|uniref:Citrate synthase-lysine N-methyltransferase CSKMT, mitochondrial n=4 Tax=Mustela putorius furo TaxID=9669 RepID=A0A8U0UL26_MUSPF|nr:citrate synthase-lysine N-methyltransferase CSKMT, mitochondrial isoform X1 [Mustela putorius furo]XP_059259777.1 citrate synthase-lysine N-methyltransferase CSKMT, mitochondrial isoform X1 [Mustela nigripes]
MYGGRGKGLWSPRRHVFGARGIPSAGSILKRRDTASEKRGGTEVLQAPPSCAHAFSFDFRSLEPPLEPEQSRPLFNCPLQTIKDDRTLIALLLDLRLLRAAFRGRLSGRPCRDLQMAALRRTLHVATLAAGARRALAGSLAGSCLADRRLWDKLHADTQKGHVPTFDWFFGYEETQGLLLPLLQETSAVCPPRVLDVGCGTSSLCIGLYTQCPHPVDVLGVDFSPVAIAHMKRLLEGGEGQTPLCPGHPASRLHFMQADAQNLEPVASSGSFHLVLDKGTWDAVARGGPKGAYQLLSECLRVLSPQGTLIQFSDEDPDVRLPYLEQGSPGWRVTVQEVGPFGGITYFAYLVQGSH